MITDKFIDFFALIKDKKGSLLAIDFGLKNVGIAITDNDLKIAMPLVVLNNDQNLVAKICDILTQNKSMAIVCGWPLDMNGGVHLHGENILFLCGNLFKLTSLPILLWDESMSTRNALDKVYELDTKRGDKFVKRVGKGKDDHLAAQFILDQILDKICDKNNR